MTTDLENQGASVLWADAKRAIDLMLAEYCRLFPRVFTKEDAKAWQRYFELALLGSGTEPKYRATEITAGFLACISQWKSPRVWPAPGLIAEAAHEEAEDRLREEREATRLLRERERYPPVSGPAVRTGTAETIRRIKDRVQNGR